MIILNNFFQYRITVFLDWFNKLLCRAWSWYILLQSKMESSLILLRYDFMTFYIFWVNQTYLNLSIFVIWELLSNAIWSGHLVEMIQIIITINRFGGTSVNLFTSHVVGGFICALDRPQLHNLPPCVAVVARLRPLLIFLPDLVPNMRSKICFFFRRLTWTQLADILCQVGLLHRSSRRVASFVE